LGFQGVNATTKKRRREEEKKWDADERGKTRIEKQRISAAIRAPSVLVRVPSS
jgi:hypothetical protein